jgi:hypothetical protein
MVLDFFFSAVNNNDASFYWHAKNMHDLLPENDINKAIQMYRNSLEGQFIDDVHYWPFSDLGFIKFLYDLTRADLINYNCKMFIPTRENTQEFVIVMQKNEYWNKDTELNILRQFYGQASVASSNLIKNENIIKKYILNILRIIIPSKILRKKMRNIYDFMKGRNVQ